MMPGIYFDNLNYNSYKGKTTGGTFKIVAYIDKDGITKCRKQKTTFNKPELRLDLILNNGDNIKFLRSMESPNIFYFTYGFGYTFNRNS